MTDHAQEQADEIEALQSIFPDTFVSLSDTSFTIRVCSEESSEEGFNTAITLKIAYTPSYPDEAPEIGLSDPQNVEESEVDEGKALLAEQAADNLGMVMVFTLQAALKEWLDTMSDKRKAEAEEVEKKKEEAKRKAEEEEAKRLIGTPVTPETFKAWWSKFEKELQAKKAKEDKEAKEKEKKAGTSVGLTGREMFEERAAAKARDAKAAMAAEGGGDSKVEVDTAVFADLDLEGDDFDFDDEDFTDDEDEDDED